MNFRGTTLVGCQAQPTLSNGPIEAIGCAITLRRRPELMVLCRTFTRAALEGTSAGFSRARVSVYALASLSVFRRRTFLLHSY
jgi:hypothetical protein